MRVGWEVIICWGWVMSSAAWGGPLMVSRLGDFTHKLPGANFLKPVVGVMGAEQSGIISTATSKVGDVQVEVPIWRAIFIRIIRILLSGRSYLLSLSSWFGLSCHDTASIKDFEASSLGQMDYMDPKFILPRPWEIISWPYYKTADAWLEIFAIRSWNWRICNDHARIVSP
jgi:hypothetical protein